MYSIIVPPISQGWDDTRVSFQRRMRQYPDFSHHSFIRSVQLGLWAASDEHALNGDEVRLIFGAHTDFSVDAKAGSRSLNLIKDQVSGLNVRKISESFQYLTDNGIFTVMRNLRWSLANICYTFCKPPKQSIQSLGRVMERI